MASYIGNVPAAQATQTRQSLTAVAGQTNFSTAGYTSGYLDVYLNGVHLEPTDFEATNGADIVLLAPCEVDDILTYVSYTTFDLVALDAYATTDYVDDAIANVDVTSELAQVAADYQAADATNLESAKSYTDSAVAGLVDTAPATLDTLNELAAALGDDPNFATTVTSSIGTKVNKAGDTLTGNLKFGDGIRADFGDSNDLQIQHYNGENSIRGGKPLTLWGKDLPGSNAMTLGAVDAIYATFEWAGPATLYYNNSAKLATTDTGVSVTGNVDVSGTVDGVDVGAFKTAYDSHGHAIADVTGLQAALDGKQAAGSYAAANHVHSYNDLTDKPEIPEPAQAGMFFENDTTLTSDYTITAGKNAMTAGPITIADGVTVTIPDGSTWTVV